MFKIFPYDLPFSHNTYVTNDRQADDRRIVPQTPAYSIDVARQIAAYIAKRTVDYPVSNVK